MGLGRWFTAFVMLLNAGMVPAQEVVTLSPDRIHSMGQPRSFQMNISASVERFLKENENGIALSTEFRKNLMGPHYQMVNFDFGMTVARHGGKTDFLPEAGISLSFMTLWMEYSTLDKKLLPKFSINPFFGLRGGIFKIGDSLRINVSKRSVGVGIEVFNIFDSNRTRHGAQHVLLPKADRSRAKDEEFPFDERTVTALADLEHRANWIDQLTSPNITPDGWDKEEAWDKAGEKIEELRAHISQVGHNYDSEVRAYHQDIETLMETVSGDATLGAELAKETRKAMLYDVIVPLNHFYGRMINHVYFEKPIQDASARFSMRLEKTSMSEVDKRRTMAVFRAILKTVTAKVLKNQKRWDSNLRNIRTLWIPVQLAVTPENLENQEKMNEIIAAIVGVPFLPNKSIEYVHNSRFIDDYMNMVLKTENYQVLVIHDFKGFTAGGRPDEIAWKTAANGYIQAYLNAIEKMNAGKTKELPRFYIFVDETYYAQNKSAGIMTYLENLYKFPKSEQLPAGPLKTLIDGQLAKLKTAVDTSPAIKKLGGKKYLEERLKVFVNVTNRFNGSNPFYASIMDHRKFAFADVDESTPNKGSGIATGQGIGEEYLGFGWEDRSVRFEGPTTIAMKTATRDLFAKGSRKPVPPDLLPKDPLIDDGIQDPKAPKLMFANTETSYGKKEGTVLKAALYTMMPKGSIMIAPDSIWTSDIWAGMFIGAALRGCHMYPIMPALPNAAARGDIIFQGTHEAATLMTIAAHNLSTEISAAGGSLSVGFYTVKSDVEDMRDRLLDIESPRTVAPFFDQQFPFSLETRQKAKGVISNFLDGYTGPDHVINEKFFEAPRLHMKDQLFVSPAAQKIFANPEWPAIVHKYLKVRGAQTTHNDQEAKVTPAIFEALRGAMDPKSVMYVTVGSHNQDRRSMWLNGESTVAVAGFDSLIGALDFYFLMKKAAWPKNEKEISEYMPPTKSKLTDILVRYLREHI